MFAMPAPPIVMRLALVLFRSPFESSRSLAFAGLLPSQRTLPPMCILRAWPAVNARLMAPSRPSSDGGEQLMGGERRRSADRRR